MSSMTWDDSRFLGDAFTFDDLLLVPAYSEILPSQVSLGGRLTKRLRLNIPLLSAAMDTVTESKTAIVMAQEGGIGIIHKNLSIQDQAFEVEKVKKSEWGMILDPVTIEPSAPISKALDLMSKFKISGIPVTVKETYGLKLIGIITNRDLRFEEQTNLKVEDRMTRMPLATVPVGTSLDEAKLVLREKRVEKLPVVDEKGFLRGLITVKDLQKRLAYPNANKDQFGRLVVGAAVGVGEESLRRADALVEAGVDVICVDSAHGHSKGVIEMVALLKRRLGNKVDVIGGNVGTAAGAKALAEAGADAVKVGIGPGSICTTRIIAGIGVPQLYAISEAVKGVKDFDIPVIADGGIRYSGDATKALALGAEALMIGGLFAGTDEAPGEQVLYQGRSFKVYRGMGSMGAMTQNQNSRDRYMQSDIDEVGKLVPEGIEGRVPYRGNLSFNVQQMLGGIRAGMGYCGAEDLNKLREVARFVRITNSGLAESHPHDVMITKEAPNYRLKS